MAAHRESAYDAVQENIHRYCKLLMTDLTVLERQYIQARIANERARLEVILEREANAA